ncbi:DUF2167 domain-containing protein [Emticicia soli]|uniref:DUF2167 domain-containing protein n=1 Tax=Emticicia soli TaxID=2027878 RepID=A0ABW5JDU1_9BACT
MTKFFTTLAVLCIVLSNSVFAQKEKESTEVLDSSFVKILTILQELKYEPAGKTIELGGMGKLTVPKGFKYLNSTQSKQVLEDIWGNPPNEAPLGMLFQENGSPVDSVNTWAFIIRYDPIGYVKDEDADDVDYKELLEQMQKEVEEANTERSKLGYGTVSLVGWASTPFYDKERKTLHWAKNLKFSGEETNTLNYDVRVLGRKGMFSLNAVGDLTALSQIKPKINDMIASVSFSDGNRYQDYDSNLDQVAAVGIGGLVAGKVLAKVGFFALLAKFWKVIVGAIIVGGGAIRKFFGKKKDDTETDTDTNVSPSEPDNTETQAS